MKRRSNRRSVHRSGCYPVAFVASARWCSAGGLSIALRRNYRLAKLACVLAALNFPHLCCVPGARCSGCGAFWMLNSDEGREHFWA